MVVGKAETRGLRLEIGRQLREARLDAGHTQVNMAAEIGMPSTYLSEVETGKHNITLDTLAGIASYLGLDVKVEFVPKPTRKRRAARK
jgi:transcriptional regulator with XRE-family HTH domain